MYTYKCSRMCSHFPFKFLFASCPLVASTLYISTFASTSYFPFHFILSFFCPAVQCSHFPFEFLFTSCPLVASTSPPLHLHHTFLSILSYLFFALLYSAAIFHLSSCSLLAPWLHLHLHLCIYIILSFPFYSYLFFCPAVQRSHQCNAAVFHLSSCSLLAAASAESNPSCCVHFSLGIPWPQKIMMHQISLRINLTHSLHTMEKSIHKWKHKNNRCSNQY